jgi:hypothetical protein
VVENSVSSDTVWHAQNGLWRRLGANPISPGQVSGKPIIGGAIASNLETDWETFEGQVGTLNIRRSYAGVSGGNPVLPATFAASNAGIDVGKRQSMWSFKATPSVFAAGTNDAWFSSFLDSIPAGHQTIIILWHEPEGELNKGDFTLADWKAANNRMGAMVHAKGRSELRSAICVIGAWNFTPSNPGYNTEFWDSGFTANIDYIGFDPYDQGGDFTPLASQPYFMKAYNWAVSHGKPIMFPEFGVSDDPGGDATKKANWIANTYQFGISASMYAMLYFNASGTIAGVPLTTSQSIAAYAAINADSKVS